MYRRICKWPGFGRSQKDSRPQTSPFSGFSRTLHHEQLEDRRVLATLTVSVDYDGIVNSNDGNLTLREAIAYVNDDNDPGVNDLAHIDLTEPFGTNDTIIFDPAVFGIPDDPQTIDLIDQLSITEAVTIDAEGQGIVIDAGHGTDAMPFDGTGFRVFNINISAGLGETKEVALVGLVITGGDVSGTRSGGGVYFAGNHGGIALSGETKFKLRDSIVVNNHAGVEGGGVFISNNLVAAIPSTSVKIENSFVLRNLVETSNYVGELMRGGGIYLQLNNTRAEFTNVTIEGNENLAGDDPNINDFGRGGGFHAGLEERSILTVVDSRIFDNTAGWGGGIDVVAVGASLVNKPEFIISDSTVYKNHAKHEGGGISFKGTGYGEFRAVNSTVSGNDTFDTSNGKGGGLFVWGETSGNPDQAIDTFLTNVTNTKNTSYSGGGIEIENSFLSVGVGVRASINNSIISENLDYEGYNDLVGSFDIANSHYNLIGSVTLPMLYPLDYYGGLTPTHKLMPGSPAIDAGHPPDSPFIPTEFDQRGAGYPRVLNGKGDSAAPRIDIGAVEVRGTAGVPPRILDVRVDQRGTTEDWAGEAQVSFLERVGKNKQFHSIGTEGANTIEIVFSKPVTVLADALTLEYTEVNPAGGVFTTLLTSADLVAGGFEVGLNSADEYVAAWTFNSLAPDVFLPNGKYAIHLDTTKVFDGADELDADWENGNDDNGKDENGNDLANTPDNVQDDKDQHFIVGDEASGTVGDEFRLHFAILQGDYDGDHDVDGGDYIWYQLGIDSDGNGDGVVDTGDYPIWADNYGKFLPLRAADGDLNDDEIVNRGDLEIILNFYGSTTATAEQGDLNGDGDVDGEDYLIWQHYFDQRSAWYDLANAPQLLALETPASIPGLAPFITDITIGKHASTVTPHSFSSLFGTGEQLRSVPFAGADKITLQFSEWVGQSGEPSFPGLNREMLEIINLDGNSPDVLTGAFSTRGRFNSSGPYTATWRFNSPLEDGRYLIRLKDGRHGPAIDQDGDLLDGEINNPWSLSDSSAPQGTSGDGEAGGDFRFRFTIMSGDTDRDNIDGTTDYTDWPSIEPGMILVSNENDELDSDYSVGDLSLREAVQLANAAAEPTTIALPTGHYLLDRVGTEVGNASYNDLDITGNVTIQGDGAGLSVIEVDAALTGVDGRAFVLHQGSNVFLELNSVTIFSSASTYYGGHAVWAWGGSTLVIDSSALVNSTSLELGTAVESIDANVTILRSVFSGNTNPYSASAIYATTWGGDGGSLTIGETVFALNSATWYKNIVAHNAVTKVNLGNNMYDDATGGFFDTTPGVGDILGTPTHVVTSVADTFDHTDDAYALSLREAVDLANNDSVASEVWLPAWNFMLTRDRATYGGGSATDMDVAFGDLDISESLVVRGVAGKTRISWMSGVVDRVFDLFGDYANNFGQDPINDRTTDLTDYYEVLHQFGSSGVYGEFTADGDDDGDVDQYDLDIVNNYYGNSLGLFGVIIE